MDKLPYYITEPNSFMSYVKGTIDYWFPTFISYWWWFAVVMVLALLISIIFNRGFNLLKEKKFLKTITFAIFCVYVFLITFLFAPFRYHCSTHDKWNKFVDECIEKGQFEYLDSVSDIHYGKVKID